MAMIIRKTALEDLPRVMEIYAGAREFMAANGNPNQWGPTNWPPEERIREDIAEGNGYVCEADGKVVGAFYYIFGDHIDPTYDYIEDGKWKEDTPYGVIHRLASDRSVPGIGAFCLEWGKAKSGHLRVDTHGDNAPMQNLLGKLGFTHQGTIYVEEDDYPRLAYEFIGKPSSW